MNVSMFGLSSLFAVSFIPTLHMDSQLDPGRHEASPHEKETQCIKGLNFYLLHFENLRSTGRFQKELCPI